MAQDNAKALQQLLKVFSADKIVSPEDVQAVLGGIVTLLGNNKKGVDALNAENKALVQKALAFVVDEVAKVRQDTVNSHVKLTSDIQTKTQKTLDQATALIAEARAAMPKDGKDADPAAVVPLVLEQIKLPENKQYILTGEDVLNSLNNLPAEDEEYKIDASRIKNLPRLRGQILHGGFRNPRVYNGSTLVAKAMPALKFTGSVTASAAADGTVTVNVSGGGISGTASFNETPSGTIDGSNAVFTLAHAPNQTSIPLFLFLNGARQRAGSVDFTLSGATITFVTPPEAGSALWADYYY